MNQFMKEALKEARKGLREGGIPIGAVLVRKGRIIGWGRNRRVQLKSPILHAEIDCFRNAGLIKDYRGAVLYSTLMPCYMCAGAIVHIGIKRVVVGENLNYRGTERFLRAHGVRVVNLRSRKCAELLGQFIRKHRELWREDSGR
ncbi:MAG: cytosine deaminase [Hadesarchaea archaeon DG-33-1]|nr:MAG: cytosine deaminase [Hadesarchaea archaeon DG-33-1]